VKVSINYFETKGLRCPDTRLNFLRSGVVAKLNMIMMPNGTGKTTIVKLLEHALSGRRFTSAEIKELKSQDYETDVGSFVIQLGIDRGQSDPRIDVSIMLEFDFSTNTCEYWTSMPPSGRELGYRPPNILKPYLREGCVDVFAFQGDKAEKLTDISKHDADDAVNAFFGFDWIEDAAKVIEDDFSRRISTRTRTLHGNKDKITKNKRLYENWKSAEKNLIKKLEEKKEARRNLVADVNNLKARYDQLLNRNKQHEEESKTIQQELLTAQADLNLSSVELMDSLRNPFFLSTEMQKDLDDLRQNLDDLELPGTSKVFFVELTKRATECICGRPMDHDAKENILRKSDEYLGPDAVMVVNGIKDGIEKFSSKANSIRDELDPVNIFLENIKKLEEKTQNKNLFERKVYAAASDQEKEQLDHYEKMIAELSKLDQEIHKYEGTSSDVCDPDRARSAGAQYCENIPAARQVIQQYLDELSALTQAQKEFDAKKKITEILTSASVIASSLIKKKLTELCNQKIVKILPRGTHVKVKKIDKNITLETLTGTEKRRGSGGESAAVAYSFVSSVLEEANIAFPLIVDHPVTALQFSARKELSEVLKKISHQFIGFLIDSEVQDFASPFAEDSEAYFFTLFRDIEGNGIYKERLPADDTKIYKSKNGVLCLDAQYFMNFKEQENEEEADV